MFTQQLDVFLVDFVNVIGINLLDTEAYRNQIGEEGGEIQNFPTEKPQFCKQGE